MGPYRKRAAVELDPEPVAVAAPEPDEPGEGVALVARGREVGGIELEGGTPRQMAVLALVVAVALGLGIAFVLFPPP